MKHIFYFLLFLFCLSGCNGCSKSGRKNQFNGSRTPTHKSSPGIRPIDSNRPKVVDPPNKTQTKPIGGSLSEMYERLRPSVFQVVVSYSDGGSAQGSGFFISSTGIGISNYHVFKGGIRNEVYIKTFDGTIFKVGEVLEFDEKMDYIVFKLITDNSNFPPIPIAENQPLVGEDVFAIGNPKGLENTLSKGIVSAYRENDLYIQTTAEITHGSSGGALFNMRGEVVGITSAGFGEADINFAMNLQKLRVKKFVNR